MFQQKAALSAARDGGPGDGIHKMVPQALSGSFDWSDFSFGCPMQAGRSFSKNSLWVIPQRTHALDSKSKRCPRAVRSTGICCFVECSVKLFDKGASDLQIGKAPMVSLVSPNGLSESEWDVASLVKTNNLTVQFEIQSIRGDRHLDNKGVFALVGDRLAAAIK